MYTLAQMTWNPKIEVWYVDQNLESQQTFYMSISLICNGCHFMQKPALMENIC